MERYLILSVAFFAIWGGHWMPWRVVPFLVDERGDLHRPVAYGYGCGWILLCMAAWAHCRSGVVSLVSPWEAVRFLAEALVAAALGAIVPRCITWVISAQRLKEDIADYEQAITD